MRSRTALTATALTTTALLLTACTSAGEPKTIRVTVTQTVSSTPEADASPNASADALKMGTKKTLDDSTNDTHFTAQVTEYQQPHKGPQPETPTDLGGDIWATVNVKVCNLRGATFSVGQTAWSLEYDDGTSVESTGLSGGDMPKPEYPMDRAVKPGRCAAGLISYPVDSKKRPARVTYAPESGESAEWAVPST
ncbi:DUF4352 domain-containing protein [Streptomyces griseoviridis]